MISPLALMFVVGCDAAVLMPNVLNAVSDPVGYTQRQRRIRDPGSVRDAVGERGIDGRKAAAHFN